MNQKWRWACAFVLLLSKTSFSDEFRLKFVPSHSISGLVWNEDRDTSEPFIQQREKIVNSNIPEGSPYFVRLQGRLKSSSDKLLYQSKEISTRDGGGFEIVVDVNGLETEFSLTKIRVTGEIEVENNKLLFMEWENFRRNLSVSKKLTFQAGLSISGTNYTQSDSASSSTNNVSQYAFNFQGESRYQWKEFLAFRTQASVTLLPIGGGSGNTIRFLNMDAQIIYPLRIAHSYWMFEIAGDYSYRTTFSSQPVFGYNNIQGVTIFPRIEKGFSKDKNVWVAIKWIPILAAINNGIPSANTISYELNFKAGYQGIRIKKKWIEIIGEVTLFSLDYGGSSSAGSIRANSYTLGANFLF